MKVFQIFIVLFLFPGTASAFQIPPGMEARVLGLLRPYSVEAGEDDVGNGVLLNSVTIDREVIKIELKKGEATAVLVLSPNGSVEKPSVGRTRSFDAEWSGETPAAAFLAAGRSVLKAIDSNDDGSFWVGLPAGSFDSVRAEAPPLGSTQYLWTDFIGEALLVCLLLLFFLTRRSFLPIIVGRPRWFWLALPLVAGAAFGYRLAATPDKLRSRAEVSSECAGDAHCTPPNECFRGICEQQKCRYEWAPPPGSRCCRTDADCTGEAEWCWELFCDLERNQCTERPKAACTEGLYGGFSGPPANTSVGWLFAVPAKYTGNTKEAAQWYNTVLWALSSVMLALMLAAWGAPSGAALAAAFMHAFLPAGLVAAQFPSMAGLLSFFVYLFFMVLAPMACRGKTASRNSLLHAVLAGLLFFVLESARPEAFLLLLPATGMFLAAGRRKLSLDLALLAGIALVSILSRFVLLSTEELRACFPPLSSSFPDSLVTSLVLLFVDGVAVPFMLLLLALLGVPGLYRSNKPLFWLAFVLFLFIPLPLGFFSLDPSQVTRYSLVPLTSLLVLGGYGMLWIGTRNVRTAWVAVLILVIYFAVFPWARLDKLQGLLKGGETTSLFLEI